MAQTVSDHIIQRLYSWGVRTIYGYPGDGINGLMGALGRADGRIRFIQALRSDRPVVVECHTDPEVPPLPPHVTFKQAKNFMSSIMHRDPNRWRMVAQSAKQIWAGMVAK